MLPIRRILLVKTSSLGDVVHNLPVVADIRAAVPGARIEWVVEEAFADIPRMHPNVARVIPVAMRRWRRTLMAPATWREIRAFRHALRSEAYDLVIDTQGLLKSALLAVQARGVRCGMDRATAREPLAALFYNRIYTVARGRHAVVRNRDLAAQATGTALPQTPPDYGIRAPGDAPVELPGDYAVCLHGTSRDSKLWPEQNWIAFARNLVAQGTAPLLPWGSEQERVRAERIAAQAAGARVLPRLAVAALATVLERARVVVGVDSGLTHLAVALNCPTVAIYTDTAPELTGVYPAGPMRAVNLGDRGAAPSLAEVEAAVQKVLKTWR